MGPSGLAPSVGWGQGFLKACTIRVVLWHSRCRRRIRRNSLPAGRIAFTYPDFTIYQAARFFIVAALEMQSVAVGWQPYEITRRPLDLGLIGLAQFLPACSCFWFRDMWRTVDQHKVVTFVLLQLRRFFRTAVGDRLERKPFCFI